MAASVLTAKEQNSPSLPETRVWASGDFFPARTLRSAPPSSTLAWGWRICSYEIAVERLVGKYFPYGQERPSATQDGKEKFATYFRDSETGLDYAQNRYHQPGMGRFMTPDPYGGSADPKDPSSWNRYSYTGGDPVNRSDSSGLDWIYDFSTGTWHSSLDFYDLCYMNAGACQQMFSGSVFAYDLGEASWWNFLQFSGTYDMTSDYYYIAAHGGNAVGSDCRQAVTNAVIYQRSLDLGLNFYNVGFTNSSGDTTVAGYTVHNGGFDSQTEMLWTGGDWDALQQQLEAMGWQHSTDTLHGDFSDSWRQPGAEYSMQISHDPNTGNFQVDIDPHNPNGALLGHTWDVIRNTLTYSDTNYNDVANHFGYNVTACP